MKRPLCAALCLALAGCQSAGYQQYADAMARIAESQASVAREQAQAMVALARDPQAGDTTRSIAVLMLALGAQNGRAQVQVAPPQNETLQWLSVILPSVSTLALGYWGYQTSKVVSNNQASTTIASYEALGQFRPVPIDWSALGALRPNETTNTTNTLTNTGNGAAVLGGGSASVDNRVINPLPVVEPVGFGP